MSFLGLDPGQEDALREHAQLNPLDVSKLGAGFFDGAVMGAPMGLVKGLVAEPARALNLALSAVPRAVDAARGGTAAQDWWFENMVSPRSGVGKLSAELAADPHTTGLAGRIMHSLFDVGGQALTVGPTGAAVLKGTNRATELVEKGVDTGTALKVGATEGVAVGIGVHLPMSLGLRTVGNALYGAVASVVPSMGQRLTAHEILAAAGHKELAEQYRWLDLEQIAIDGVLGIAFGGLGTMIEVRQAKALRETVRTADVEAALTANNARHIELETAPGIPKDFASRDAHVAAVMKATDDLMHGRPVDVGATRVGEAEFVNDPRRAELREQLRPLVKPYEELDARVRAEAANDAQPVLMRPELEPARTEPIAEGRVAPLRDPEEVGAGRAVLPEYMHAETLASRFPDLEVRLEDGATVSARDALARAETDIAMRTNTAKAFDAAVACFLRG